jgi:hypothetical protein
MWCAGRSQQKTKMFEMEARQLRGKSAAVAPSAEQSIADEKLLERVRCLLFMCKPLFEGMDVRFLGTVKLKKINAMMKVRLARPCRCFRLYVYLIRLCLLLDEQIPLPQKHVVALALLFERLNNRHTGHITMNQLGNWVCPESRMLEESGNPTLMLKFLKQQQKWCFSAR